MDEDNITRFPIKTHQRWKNRLGRRAVPCLVSDRWLQFPGNSDLLEGEHYMFVDVMTIADGKNARKLTTVCLSKERVLAALGIVE